MQLPWTGMGLPLSVLDLPVACLKEVVGKLDTASRLSLFCTCKGFSDLVLDSADSTKLKLQPVEVQQKQMLKALEFVHQHARGVAVCMHGWQLHEKDEASAQHARQLAECSCSLLHQAQLMGYLDRVTSLELVGAMLAMPLMPVFSESCPNLAALTLQNSRITWEGVTVDSFRGVWSNLHSLHLHNVTGQAPSETCQQGLQQQVAHLTGLQSLHLTTGAARERHRTPLYTSIAAALTQPIIGQLSEFALPCCQVPFPATWQWNFSHLKHVQKLHLDNTTLNDALMQQVLPLPNLKSVSVATVSLQQSYRGLVCPWQQLQVQNALGLDALARLPFHSDLQLQGQLNRHTFCMVLPTSATATVEQAKNNIITSRWGGWAGAHGAIFSFKGEDSEVLPHVLSLLNGAGRVDLVGFNLHKPALEELGDFACSQQQGIVLDLSNACVLAVADVAILIGRLPAGSSLVMSHIKEADVTQLCSAAQRSFALHVRCMGHACGDAKVHIEAALTHAGGVFIHEAKINIKTWDWVVVVNPVITADISNATSHSDSLNWARSLQPHMDHVQ